MKVEMSKPPVADIKKKKKKIPWKAMTKPTELASLTVGSGTIC